MTNNKQQNPQEVWHTAGQKIYALMNTPELAPVKKALSQIYRVCMKRSVELLSEDRKMGLSKDIASDFRDLRDLGDSAKKADVELTIVDEDASIDETIFEVSAHVHCYGEDREELRHALSGALIEAKKKYVFLSSPRVLTILRSGKTDSSGQTRNIAQVAFEVSALDSREARNKINDLQEFLSSETGWDVVFTNQDVKEKGDAYGYKKSLYEEYDLFDLKKKTIYEKYVSARGYKVKKEYDLKK
jgi:hypothetical protein